MKIINEDWCTYLSKNNNHSYLIIDPPWNFRDKPPKVMGQLNYRLWDDNIKEFAILLKLSNANYIFVWVPNSLLDEILFSTIGKFNSLPKYRYKTLVTWIKKTVNGKDHYGLGSWFRNSTEQLVILAKRNAKPFRFNLRNVVYARTRPSTGKPREFEIQLLENLNNKGFVYGAYLFSGIEELDCFKDFSIDLVDIKHNGI